MKLVKDVCMHRSAALAIIAAIGLLANPLAALAEPPTAEVAKRCQHYAYIVYPFKRPGAVPMSGDREAYFRNCLAKNGDVPAPARPNQAGPAIEKSEGSATKNN